MYIHTIKEYNDCETDPECYLKDALRLSVRLSSPVSFCIVTWIRCASKAVWNFYFLVFDSICHSSYFDVENALRCFECSFFMGWLTRL